MADTTPPTREQAQAAARRIADGDYAAGASALTARIVRKQKDQDADLLAAFVVAGDTERLRAALKRLAGPSSFKPHDEAAALYQAEVEQIAREALAEGNS